MCDPRLLYIRMTSIINYYSAFQCLIGQAALAMHNDTRHSSFCDGLPVINYVDLFGRKNNPKQTMNILLHWARSQNNPWPSVGD